MAMSVLQPGTMGSRGNKQSTILFKTDFTNTTLPGYTNSGQSAKNKISGANNGYQWPVSGGGSNQRLNALEAYVQLINDFDTVTSVNAINYGTADILPVNDLPGYTGNQLSLVLKDTGAIHNSGVNTPWDGQNDFIFSRAADGSVVPPDLTDLYLRYYIKYPGSLYTALQAGVSNRDRAIMSEFKTGAFVTSWDGVVHYVGDLRINMALQKASTGIVYVNTHCDQGANGNAPGTIPSTIDKKDIWSVTAPDYWSVDSYNAPIVFDQWMKVEYYMHRHQTAGLFKAAINDRIVCNYTGRTLGQYSCPVGRLMPWMAYSGAGPCAVSGCDLEIRDLPPIGSVLLPL